MNNKFFGFGLIFSPILFMFSSWILVHILAVFGVFLALAYPIWWLFSPNYAVCMICRAKKDGELCTLCNRKIVKKDGVSPRNITSALLNGGIVIVLSIASIAIVYAESRILYALGFPATAQTASVVIPSKGQFRIDEIFPMKIEIENVENAVNAVQIDLGFDSEKVEVVDISTRDSFANVFIQKEINNEGGWARLTGGLPNPGWFDTKGLFGTVYFRAKNAGIVKVNFLSSSMVLANDTRGTNILKDLPSVSYLILPEKISEEEAKDQEQLIIYNTVLGESTESGKLIFYEQGSSSILGEYTENEIEEKQEAGHLNWLLSLLEKFDRIILSFWDRILSLISPHTSKLSPDSDS